MFGHKPKIKPVLSTPFSEFIRNAKAGEKKRVYTDVMRKASEEQNRVLSRSTPAKQGRCGQCPHPAFLLRVNPAPRVKRS